MNRMLTLSDYAAVLRRRGWVIIVVLLVALAGTVGWLASQTSMYRSSARILITHSTAADVFDPTSGQSLSRAERLAENEALLARSFLVESETVDRLGYEPDVSVQLSSGTDSLVISAISDDPGAAQQAAQVWAESYLSVRSERFVSDRLATADGLLASIAEIDAQLGSAQGQDLVRLEALRRDLANSLDRLNLAADLSRGSGAQIIDPARLPTEPFAPALIQSLVMAALGGVLLGVSLAFLLESLDRAVRSPETVAATVPGVPVLAMVPTRQRGSSIDVVTFTDATSREAEAYRNLRAALLFASLDRDIKRIQVTSALASEGKTSSAINLAAVFAQAGNKVRLVDADLRRPRVHHVLGLPEKPGFTSLVLSRKRQAARGHSISVDAGELIVHPSGPLPPGPSEMLGSDTARRAFDVLAESCDIMIVDCPPVLPVSDPLVVASYVDATVLIVDATRTKRDELAAAVERLRQSNAPLVGVVLNKAANSRRSDGYYGYGASHASSRFPFRANSDKGSSAGRTAEPETATRLVAE